MDDIRELYQQTIIDHNRSPRHFGHANHATHQGEGLNPLCGDRVQVSLRIEDGVLADICFEGSGCAISKASASLMTEALTGKTVEQALSLCESFIQSLTAETPSQSSLGKLDVFLGVREFPARVKCASLAWHAMKAAVLQKEPVSTEQE